MVRICRPGGTIIVVNKFQSSTRIVATLERLVTPLSTWIGFRLDLPVATVTRTVGLTLVHEERVNVFGLWRLLELRKD
jgi:phosphatidylethanolamine/phosphatidyl-N-methylethanolamine N-methyltransferase